MCSKDFSSILINYTFYIYGALSENYRRFLCISMLKIFQLYLIQIQIVKCHLLFTGLQHKHIFYRWERYIVPILSNVLTLHQTSFHVLNYVNLFLSYIQNCVNLFITCSVISKQHSTYLIFKIRNNFWKICIL